MTTYATAAKALPATFKFHKFPDGIVCTAVKSIDGDFVVSWQFNGRVVFNDYSEADITGFLSDGYEIIEDKPAMETFQFTCPSTTLNTMTVFTYTQTSTLDGTVTWVNGYGYLENQKYSLARAKGYLKEGNWTLVKPIEEESVAIMEASTAATSAWQHHIEQLDKDADENKCIVSIDEIKAFTEATGAHVHIFESGYTLGYKDDFYDVGTDAMLVTVMDAIRVLESLSMRTEEVDSEPCDDCGCYGNCDCCEF